MKILYFLLSFLFASSFVDFTKCDLCQNVQDIVSQIRANPPNNTLILGISDPNEKLNVTAPAEIYSDIFLFQNSELNFLEKNFSTNASQIITLFGNIYVTDTATLNINKVELKLTKAVFTKNSVNLLQSSKMIINETKIQSNSSIINFLSCYSSEIEFFNVTFGDVNVQFNVLGQSFFLGYNLSGTQGGLVYSQNTSQVNLAYSTIELDIILQYNCPISDQLSGLIPSPNVTLMLHSCKNMAPLLNLYNVAVSSFGIEFEYASHLSLSHSQVYFKFISPQLEMQKNEISDLRPDYYQQSQIILLNSNLILNDVNVTDWRFFLGFSLHFDFNNCILSELICSSGSFCNVTNSIMQGTDKFPGSAESRDNANLLFFNSTIHTNCTSRQSSYLRFEKSIIIKGSIQIVPTLYALETGIIILEDAIMLSEFNTETSRAAMIVGAGLGNPQNGYNLTWCDPLIITGSIYSSRTENVVYLLEIRSSSDDKKIILASGTKDGINETLAQWNPIKGNFSIVLSVYTNNGFQASFAITAHTITSSFEVLQCDSPSTFDFSTCSCSLIPLSPGLQFFEETNFRILLVCLTIVTTIITIIFCAFVYKKKKKADYIRLNSIVPIQN